MFQASHPVPFLDYFRIPYDVDAREASANGHPSLGSLRPKDADVSERTLYWPKTDDASGAVAGAWRCDSATIYARAISDPEAAAWLPGAGTWHRSSSLESVGGGSSASIWRDGAGNTFLPFDPGGAIQTFLTESYREVDSPTVARKAKGAAMRSYYRARPLLPRPAQIWMRRIFSRLQARTQFPRWPIETSLHDLHALLFQQVAQLTEARVPSIAPWPEGYSWALVLTHDVETAAGYERVPLVRELEERAGYRSSWNFVPLRYEVEDHLVDDLLKRGFEVGVHGLHHDGRDLESRATLEERLPQMRAYAERWGASGFRSPATHRDPELMPLLGFDYDSSYPDTDPFEPQGGGCCSWLPYFNGDLVELPITLPQDHTLFVILQQQDERMWLEKAEHLRSRGGMALLDTHPDYMDALVLGAYGRFLEAFGGDPTAWRALPRDIATWWRRRAASKLVRDGGEWRVVGPAAGEAAIAYTDGI